MDGEKFIFEEFSAERVSAIELDLLLAEGWRHFGNNFFRYSHNTYNNEIRRVIPLRIRIANFFRSKGQRRNIRKNGDLSISIGPADLNAEIRSLFDRHRMRFSEGRPETLESIISPLAGVPCDLKMMLVALNGKPLAASFFDVAAESVSGIYAMFEPGEAVRGLGNFTMLKEIEFAHATGRRFYYQGYCYAGNSFYDYKKRFAATEFYDWNGSWRPFAEDR